MSGNLDGKDLTSLYGLFIGIYQKRLDKYEYFHKKQ